MVNRAISLYEFFESNMRAGLGRLDVLAGEGRDEIAAAAAGSHHVVAQDLEQLTAIRARNLTDRTGVAGLSGHPGAGHDVIAAVAEADRIRYPFMIMAPAAVISVAIRDNAQESAPDAVRRSGGCL